MNKNTVLGLKNTAMNDKRFVWNIYAKEIIHKKYWTLEKNKTLYS